MRYIPPGEKGGSICILIVERIAPRPAADNCPGPTDRSPRAFVKVIVPGVSAITVEPSIDSQSDTVVLRLSKNLSLKAGKLATPAPLPFISKKVQSFKSAGKSGFRNVIEQTVKRFWQLINHIKNVFRPIQQFISTVMPSRETLLDKVYEFFDFIYDNLVPPFLKPL